MIKVALIGADSSHTIEYARRMADPSMFPDQRVRGLSPVSCFAWVTPFQNASGIAARCDVLRKLGVKLVGSFREAVSAADAIMLEMNDPAVHLEFVEKCVGCGKPVFLDKPLADSAEAAERIAAAVLRDGMRFFSASPLRFASDALTAHARVPRPRRVIVNGALGRAATGSDVVWYGVHSFELLNLFMGRGAAKVTALPDGENALCGVDFADGRRAEVRLIAGSLGYSGTLDAVNFAIHAPNAEFYGDALREVEKFFAGAAPPVELADTLEITKMLTAADRSLKSGKPVEIK